MRFLASLLVLVFVLAAAPGRAHDSDRQDRDRERAVSERAVPEGVYDGALPRADGRDEMLSRRESRRGSSGYLVIVPQSNGDVLTALWQARRPQGRPPGRRPGPPPGPPPGRRMLRRPLPPPPLLERLSKLPPEEREKILRNNKRFQELPKERQEELLERFRRFQELPPEQKDLIEQRSMIFGNLTPEQQEKAREIYEQHWRKIAPERRRALVEEFRHLRGMSSEEREKHMADPDVEEHFNPEERDLLKQLVAL